MFGQVGRKLMCAQDELEPQHLSLSDVSEYIIPDVELFERTNKSDT